LEPIFSGQTQQLLQKLVAKLDLFTEFYGPQRFGDYEEIFLIFYYHQKK
jgi:hypothetical protein